MRGSTVELKDQKENRLPAEGEYVFKVTEAKDGFSKAGNDMITLNLNIFDAEGKKRTQRDFLGSWDWNKYKGFLESVGMSDRFEDDIESYEFTGLSGKLQIKHGMNKQRGEKQANVQFYVPRLEGQDAPEIPELEEREPAATDDDVPF